MVINGITYTIASESPAQTNCSHRIQDSQGCSICGAVKRDGRWLHLSAAWFSYYMSGNNRPEKINLNS